MRTVSISTDVIDGVLQSNPVVLAACESREFIEHGIPFVRSVTDNGMPCHVHIINASPMVYEIVADLIDDIKNTFTATFEKYDMNGKTAKQHNQKYDTSRYTVLPHVLREAKKVLVLNIEALVADEIRLPAIPLAVSGNSTNPTNEALYITEEVGEVSNVLAYYSHAGECSENILKRMALELYDDILFLGDDCGVI